MDVKEFPLVAYNSNENFSDFRKLFNLEINAPVVIGGPCGVENFDMLDNVARFLSSNGVNFLRTNLYKPRSSPYSFQGLKKQGLEIVKTISKEYNMISVSEIIDVRDVELAFNYIDIFQIGSRNMQNFELIKEIGGSKKPVIIKRGMGSTLHEFILAAEYVALEGNRNIMMCERGIRTFENSVRNMLDVASIALIKRYTKLPVIADLSHSLGRKDIVNEVAKSVLVLGADGIMVEIHPNPNQALSDKYQQLNFQEAKILLKSIFNKNIYICS